MKRIKTENIRFQATRSSGNVSAVLMTPEDAKYLLVLAHGAGAGMNHPFMEMLSVKLVEKNFAVFRYQFPYFEKGRRSPDPPNILSATVRSAVEAASNKIKGLPVYAGGKSLGGRMTSTAASKEALPNVKGIIFFGFPLHAPGRPSSDRAEHLFKVNVPILFLQGTRDKLADLNLLKPVIKKLKDKAELHIIEGADHSFHVLKSSGRTDEQVIEEMAKTVSDWIIKNNNL
ncbi:MAG: dienelactone hydrolase family protein [Ignavibacteriaceae bacterium]|jgi:predicted alpha/beta-hydrolase family hydrolase